MKFSKVRALWIYLALLKQVQFTRAVVTVGECEDCCDEGGKLFNLDDNAPEITQCKTGCTLPLICLFACEFGRDFRNQVVTDINGDNYQCVSNPNAPPDGVLKLITPVPTAAPTETPTETPTDSPTEPPTDPPTDPKSTSPPNVPQSTPPPKNGANSLFDGGNGTLIVAVSGAVLLPLFLFVLYRRRKHLFKFGRGNGKQKQEKSSDSPPPSRSTLSSANPVPGQKPKKDSNAVSNKFSNRTKVDHERNNHQSIRKKAGMKKRASENKNSKKNRKPNVNKKHGKIHELAQAQPLHYSITLEQIIGKEPKEFTKSSKAKAKAKIKIKTKATDIDELL